MRGTVVMVNRAINRPILIGGVEKSLLVGNIFLTYLLLAACRFHLMASLLCAAFFMVMHALLRVVSKHDPHFAVLFKRSTRYLRRPYFPAISHPLQTQLWPIISVSVPR